MIKFWVSLLSLPMVGRKLLSIGSLVLLIGSVFGLNIGPVPAQTDNIMSQSINLGPPLFTEHYKIASSKKTIVNGTEATEVVIMGNGTVNGINITSTGKALITPRSNGVAYIEGAADFKATDSENSGKATYVFQAIGDYGAAFFNANATGNLSFLNNMVGIYKVDRNEDGNNLFTMWNWSSSLNK
jgi:hypothetical protein